MKKDEAAAVCIQRHFRGYMGRKKYLRLLYEQFEKVKSVMSRGMTVCKNETYCRQSPRGMNTKSRICFHIVG